MTTVTTKPAEIAERIVRQLTAPAFTFNNPDYLKQGTNMVFTALQRAFEDGVQAEFNRVNK